MIGRFRKKKRVPYIPQMESVECGATCLAMVLAYYDHHVPLPELRKACGVSRNGVNARSIMEAARGFGLEAQAFSLEFEGISDLPLPAILHWEFNHFVVLERFDAKSATIVDPGGGSRTLTHEYLRKAFTGVALAFAPGADFKPRKAVRPSVRRYFEIVKAHVPTLGQIMIASALLQVAGLVFPIGQQLMVDRVLVPRQESWLWGIGIGMMLAYITQTMLSFLRSWVISTLQLKMDIDLLSDFMRHLMRLPIGFFLLRKSGDLIQRMDSNRALRDLFSTQTISTLLDGFLLFSYGGLMLAYNFRLGVMVILVAAGRLAFQTALRRYQRTLLTTELAASGGANNALLESLSALETVKAAGAEGAMLRRWTDRTVEVANVSLRRSNLNIISSEVMAFASAIGTALIYGMAGYEVLNGTMTIGVFSAFLSLRGLFLAPLNSVIGAIGQWQMMSSHLQRLDDVLEVDPEPSGTRAPDRLSGEISLEKVSFGYVPFGQPVLEDISLTIHPGERIALVGPSGAGKTTLARLLLGMLIPSEGVIRFDGVDIREYDLAKLRSQVGVVLQETFMFNDTARANLTLNDPDLPQTAVEAAARLACIHDTLVALPNGYETPLGENACILSGGQRQRLALARALAHQPSILLLDEATSSLDLATEAEIHDNLTRYGCTRVIIAHRLNTVRDADRILVLDEGRIVQEGTYQELSGRPGLFRHLRESMEAVHG